MATINDDDYKEISPISSLCTVSPEVDERDDDKQSMLHQQAKEFVPSLNPLIKCNNSIRQFLISSLSNVEKQVLRSYLDGIDQAQISRSIGKSQITVSRHIKSVKLKFNIYTKDFFETIIIFHLIYKLSLPLSMVKMLANKSYKKYGSDSEAYQALHEERKHLIRKQRMMEMKDESNNSM